MTAQKLHEIALAIQQVKVAVYGDYCLDVYWFLAEEGGEISVETGKQAEAVQQSRYGPGGAGNLVANLAALQPAEIHCIGAIGGDPFGRELRRQLQALNANTDGLILQATDFDTYTYIKRYLHEEESPRIDLGQHNQLTEESITQIIAHLESSLQNCDVLILNQQVPDSLRYGSLLQQLSALTEKYADKHILLDTRQYGHAFTHIHRKINESELAELMAYQGNDLDDTQLINWGQKLFHQSGKPVFITRGEAGLIIISENELIESKPPAYDGPIDTVGAGDTLLSALSLALAADVSLEDAAEFAVLAAAVSVRKLFMTGTATVEEMGEMDGGLY